MAHVSKKKINNKVLNKIDKQLIDFFKNKKYDFVFLSDLLTKTERLMLAKRLAIMVLLKKGLSSYEISAMLKVSSSTVMRFSCRLEGKEFKKIKNKISNNMADDFIDYLLDILLISFNRPYKGVDFRKAKRFK